MSLLNVLDLLKYPLIQCIMNGTKSNIIVLEQYFFGRGGNFCIGNLNLGLDHLSNLSID
jgi:hypothetical protein